jgi:cytochrome b involved in lipid metabolism
MIDGKAISTVKDLAVGNYSVTVTYLENDKYVENSIVRTISVKEKANSSSLIDIEIDIDANSTNGTIEVKLPENATGNVTVIIDGKEYNVTNVTNGTAVIYITELLPGNHTIEVIYSGDGNYTGASNSTDIEVPKITNYLINATSSDITVGETETIGIEMSIDVTGKAIIELDGKVYYIDVNNGRASFDIDTLSNGTYTARVTYLGDELYGAKSNSTSFVVKAKANSSSIIDIEIDIDANSTNGTVVVELPEDATGNVTVIIDGKEYNVTNVTNGTAVIYITEILPGNHTIEVIYSGDGNYTGASNSTDVEVPKITNYLINATSSDITVGETETIGIELNIDVDGIVLVTIGDKGYYANIAGGKGVLYVDNLANGTYTATVTYQGNELYGAKSNSTSFVVNAKTNSSDMMDVIIDIPENSTNGTITVELPENATGNVTVIIDGKEYNVTNVTNGTAVIYITELLPGNHTVEVIYSGDGNYTGASNSTDIEVPKISDYGILVDAIVDGRDVEIDVDMSIDVDGIVIIDVNGIGYYVNATNGHAKLYLKDMINGNYIANAKFLGNDYYAPKDNTTTFIVDAKITPEIDIHIDIPINSTNGTITVELPEDATGNVTVVIDGKVYNVTNVTNGTATIQIGNLTPGNHTVEVIYSGDDNYTGASNYTVVTVPKISDYSIEVFANDINAGDKADITVKLPEDINGVVLLNIDGVGYYVDVTNGYAKFDLVLDLKSGSYDVTATYPGDDKYASKSAVDSFKVSSKDAKVEIVIKNDEIVVELPEDATGNVTVTIDGKDYVVPVIDGAAKMDISDLEPGNHTVDVTYNGDDKYNPASNSTTINIPKTHDYPMDITYDDGKVVVELPEDATGDVSVKINDKTYTVPIKDGKASVDVSDLKPGDYKVDATYAGDKKYDPAKVSDTVNIPKKSDYTMDVATTDNELIVTVPSDAIGNVTVNIDGKDYVVPIENGQAVVDISNLTTGKHDVKVVYPGDDKYANKSIEKVIDKTHCLIITAPEVVKYYSGPERFIVYFRDNDGNNVDGITVKITINSRTYERTSVDGQASLALNLNSANYSVTVEFAGNDEFKPQKVASFVEVLPTIYANDVTKVFRNGTQYYALFLDEEGNPLSNTEVSFNINGVFYKRITNESGWAKLNLNLAKGTYILTAINPVTSEMRTNVVTVISQLETHDLTKYFKNDSQFVVRVRADDGSWAKAGEIVKFNVQGRLYERVTNETGHAVLKINLEPGEYRVTTYYGDCREGNDITVLPVLTAKDLRMEYLDGSQFKATLVDGQGKVYAGQTITFNINGVFYNRTTDSDGVAKLNIRLQPGEYIITSQYGDARISNTIKIEA